MESIAQLYKDVMDGVEKTAADTSADAGPEFDQSFFEKVASGEEESVNALNEFITEAQNEGYSDDEIEEAVAEAMHASGYEDDGEAIGEPDTDEYEAAKHAAYMEGVQEALNDALESDMAKEAGVTNDDLVDFDLGSHFGAGYVETRQMLDEAIEKIAAKKGKAGKGVLQRIHGGIAKAVGGKGATEKSLEGYSRAMSKGEATGKFKGKRGAKLREKLLQRAGRESTRAGKRQASRRATAIMAGVPAAALGLGAAGGYAAGRNRD